MAIVEIEVEKQRKTRSVTGLVSLAVLLAVVSVAAWQLIALLESARSGRLGTNEHTIGRALSESDPELFAREMKEHRDAQAENSK